MGGIGSRTCLPLLRAPRHIECARNIRFGICTRSAGSFGSGRVSPPPVDADDHRFMGIHGVESSAGLHDKADRSATKHGRAISIRQMRLPLRHRHCHPPKPTLKVGHWREASVLAIAKKGAISYEVLRLILTVAKWSKWLRYANSRYLLRLSDRAAFAVVASISACLRWR